MAVTPLDRLARLDTSTVSDALDFLQLPGATVGILPLWHCPRIVGRASTVRLGPKRDAASTVHLISPVIAAVDSDDRVIVIAGGVDRISCWGEILANAASLKGIRGTVIDGYSRDIEANEMLAYPVYGRGATMISERNRVVQIDAGQPIRVAGVEVRENDFVIADRCGTVFVDAARIEDVLDLAENIDHRQLGMVQAVRDGRSAKGSVHNAVGVSRRL